MGLPIGWWTWAGSPTGASRTNDTGLANEQASEMAAQMTLIDLLITDRAFRSLRKKLAILCGWTKSPGKGLTHWQQQENSEISSERGKIS